MPNFERQRKRNDRWKLIGRCVVSFICVCFTHFALYLLSYIFISSSLLTLLPLSVMVLLVMTGIGKGCKRILGLRASAPAFVFMNTFFIWCVYMFVIRQAISSLPDIIFNSGLIMLLIGLYSILSSDPGFVKPGPACHDNLVNSPFPNVEGHSEGLDPSTCGEDTGFSYEESFISVQRVRYCKYCKAHVKGFDHHCPAFGNCIGQNNYRLFILLLAGFIIAEASYIACLTQITTSHINAGRKASRAEILAISTMLFSLLQVLWQGVFLTWHLYCICFSIRTDEWINWKRYPEFQHIIQPQPGQPITETSFTNPYDKGILKNLKNFIEGKG